MSTTAIRAAAQSIAEQVSLSIQGLERRLRDETVYAFALSVSDDFSMLNKAVNTESHYAKSPGGARFRWRVGEWQHNAMDLEVEPLIELLGDPTFQTDPQLQEQQPAIQARWLLALIDGLKLARDGGHLNWNGTAIAGFCTIEESDDAGWVEQHSARMVNPPERLVDLESGLAAARVDEEPGEEPGPLEAAFQALVSAERS